MLDYLKKFNNLPKDLRDKFAAPEVLAAVSSIEKKYNVSLATVIMRVLIKDIAMVDLAKFLVFEFSLDARKAESLVNELTTQVFIVAEEYLGIHKEIVPDILEKVDIASDQAMDLAREKMAIRTSSFFLSPDDEKEIQELTKKVAEHKEAEKARMAMPPDPLAMPVAPAQPIEKKVSDVMQKVELSFSSEDLDNRFKNIVETYLRGVRNKIDVKQAMVKDVAVGGLSMSEGAINEIIAKIDEVKKGYEEPKLVQPLPSSSLLAKGIRQEAGSRDLEYDFSKLKEIKATPTVEAVKIDAPSAPSNTPVAPAPNPEPVVPVSIPVPPPIPRVKATFKNFSFIDDSKIADDVVSGPKFNQAAPIMNSEEEMMKFAAGAKDDLMRSIGERAQKTILANDAKKIVADDKKAETSPIIEPVKTAVEPEVEKVEIRRVIPVQPLNDNKRRMEDVKYVPPKLVSPVEELRLMNLVNFRRLGQSPDEARMKIIGKIALLEQESYGRKLEGVKAWRVSPLNKLYIATGQEAISKTGGIRAIIKERQEAGLDFLTEAEFNSIMDLNKNLRF